MIIQSNERKRHDNRIIDMSLRKWLNDEINSNKSIAVYYRRKLIAIGKATDLLQKSSGDFLELLKLDIKEVVRGNTLYLVI